MQINRKLLPIKAHYFFFMAAMGPILPQLSVYGKELGISSVIMGTITGILPFVFLIAKPLFGVLVDVFRDYRKHIFMLLIATMTVSYALMNFIPPRSLLKMPFYNVSALESCNVTAFLNDSQCPPEFTEVICTSDCLPYGIGNFMARKSQNYDICTRTNVTLNKNESDTCTFECSQNVETTENACLYESSTFWSFVILMAIGTIGFNVGNSISDAICFDVIGDEHDYGKQRVWGTIGFGVTALLSGYMVDYVSGNIYSYTPAFVIMLVFSVLDLLACLKLQLPVIPSPENIFHDLKKLLNNRHVIIFIIFAIFAGILDGLIVYFLFWYLEDLALVTNTSDVKLIEGLTVAAETLGGEVLFFSISGKILQRFGHVHCFSMCFVNYALRLVLISMVPSPWYIIPVEFCLQGPTYALTYTTIVAYANELAPPGASATMQGIAAGMDDGVGYALGSIIGGILFKYIGGRHTFQLFSALGVILGVLHLLLHKTILRKPERREGDRNVEYQSTQQAIKTTYS